MELERPRLSEVGASDEEEEYNRRYDENLWRERVRLQQEIEEPYRRRQQLQHERDRRAGIICISILFILFLGTVLSCCF